MRDLQNIYGPPKKVAGESGIYSLDVMVGSGINNTVAEAIDVARGLDATARFDFNGVTVSVRSDSNPELIYRDWLRALDGYISKVVGPYPRARLRKQDIAKDARIKRKSRREHKKSDREYHLRAASHRKAIEAKLVNAPGIELGDEVGWKKFQDNNQDGYGGAVVTYSERWARLMQVEMLKGKKLEDVAEVTSREADLEGISGFMYGCAVSMLSQCWKHGDQLRRWHNIDTQIGNEGEMANETGGVLNPALVNVHIR